MNRYLHKLLCLPGIFLLLYTTGATATGQQYTLATVDLEQWLKGYETAWESRDGNLAAGLFTVDASYRESPYDEPFAGREAIKQYWERVTASQRNVDFTYDVVNVFANTGIVQWTATFNGTEGDALFELNGIFILEFETAKLCKRLREWWHFRERKPRE